MIGIQATNGPDVVASSAWEDSTAARQISEKTGCRETAT